MDKPIYLGLSILDLSKTEMYEFWYDYIKPKYQWSCIPNNAKLRYMHTESFIINIKTKNFFKNIADDVEKRFDTSNYKCDYRPLPTGNNKKIIGLMKDELGGKIMTESVALKCYVMDDGNTTKKAKGTKNV